MTFIVDGTNGLTFPNSSTQLVAAGTPPTITVYTSGSGTYTTPANTKYLQVEMVGGGGGGTGSGTTSGNLGGSSGGAGGYIKAIISPVSSSYSYAVGAGGAVGAPGTNGSAGAVGAAGIIVISAYF